MLLPFFSASWPQLPQVRIVTARQSVTHSGIDTFMVISGPCRACWELTNRNSFYVPVGFCFSFFFPQIPLLSLHLSLRHNSSIPFPTYSYFLFCPKYALYKLSPNLHTWLSTPQITTVHIYCSSLPQNISPFLLPKQCLIFFLHIILLFLSIFFFLWFEDSTGTNAFILALWYLLSLLWMGSPSVSTC